MWIAKPLKALSESERAGWEKVLSDRIRRDPDTPLAQTFPWASAASAMGAGLSLVYNPDEAVGGFVIDDGAGNYECVNGPLLDWGGEDAARQLAVFATAVSRLPGTFLSLALSPRWPADLLEAWLEDLPVPADRVDRAATRILIPAPSDAEEVAGFDPRLQRTVRQSLEHTLDSTWEPLSLGGAEGFLREMEPFAKAHGFWVPKRNWFEGFMSATGATLWRSFARVGESAERCRESEEIIARFGNGAFYLFGYQVTRGDAPAAWSASAVAQVRAIRECAALGDRRYDLGGAVEGSDSTHPYAGVSAFKSQFGGRLLSYAIPRLLIQGT